MKKILYARNAPYKPNINTYNVQAIGLCKELCKKGINCDILFFSDVDKDEIIYKNENACVRILWRKGIKVLRTGLYPKLLNRKFTRQYDLIITTEYNQIMSLLWAKLNNNIIMYNGPYYNMFKIPFMEKVYDVLFVKKINKSMRKIFVKSTLSKKYLEDKGFSNIDVLGVGLDTKIFERKVKKSQQVIDLIEFMNKNKCILYVGQLIERKNFKFLIEVYKEIYIKDPSIKLVVIGRGKEKYVKSIFNSLSIDVLNNIVHVEKVDNKELRYIYAEADLFILPSKYEIFGMVLLEAMYFGVPTLSSFNGGANTLIRNKDNGVILDNYNVGIWKKEALEILNNREYKKKLSYEANKTIINEFTWYSIANRFLKILEL